MRNRPEAQRAVKLCHERPQQASLFSERDQVYYIITELDAGELIAGSWFTYVC